MRPGIDNPLQAAAAIHTLVDSIRDNVKLSIEFNANCHSFNSIQLKDGKDSSVTPLFDPGVSLLDKDKVFWLYARDENGEVAARQAFRMEEVSTSLAEWALGWILGIYLKRGELIVPTQLVPNEHSVSHHLSGCLVYHGELWVSRNVRRRNFVEKFSKLGMILAYVRWQPDAVWALVGKAMATGGHMSRMGYPHLEPQFLTWEYIPEGADKMEWLGVADRRSLRRLVREEADQTTWISTGQTSEMTVTPL